MSDNNIVYSTDGGKVEKDKTSPVKGEAYADGFIRVRRETKGRKGKGVVTVDGIDAQNSELKKIATTLKKKCSTGGAVKDGIIEIQGDKRDIIKAELEKMGYKVKLAGG